MENIKNIQKIHEKNRKQFNRSTHYMMTAAFLDLTPHTLVENYHHLQFGRLLWNICKSLCDWIHRITCHETITFEVTTVRTLNMVYIILLTEQTWESKGILKYDDSTDRCLQNMTPDTVNEIMKRFKPHAMLNHFKSMLHIYMEIPILEMYSYLSI
jgi:hypothetical protein